MDEPIVSTKFVGSLVVGTYLLMGYMLLYSCAQAPVVAGALEKALSEAVKLYCSEPMEVRMLKRQAIAGLIAPNSAQIVCANDTTVHPDAGGVKTEVR